jgi:hypothetical protein
MESELYKRIFGDGEANGRAEGLGCTDIPSLDAWVQRAAVAFTAAGVVRAKAPATRRASKA